MQSLILRMKIAVLRPVLGMSCYPLSQYFNFQWQFVPSLLVVTWCTFSGWKAGFHRLLGCFNSVIQRYKGQQLEHYELWHLRMTKIRIRLCDVFGKMNILLNQFVFCNRYDNYDFTDCRMQRSSYPDSNAPVWGCCHSLWSGWIFLKIAFPISTLYPLETCFFGLHIYL